MLFKDLVELTKLTKATGHQEHDDELNFYSSIGDILSLPKYLNRLASFLNSIAQMDESFDITETCHNLKQVGMLQYMVCMVLKYKYLKLNLEHSPDLTLWVKNPYITREHIIELIKD